MCVGLDVMYILSYLTDCSSLTVEHVNWDTLYRCNISSVQKDSITCRVNYMVLCVPYRKNPI